MNAPPACKDPPPNPPADSPTPSSTPPSPPLTFILPNHHISPNTKSFTKKHTISSESLVSIGQELEDLGGVDEWPHRSTRRRRQGDHDFSGERPVGSNHALPGLCDVHLLEEEVAVDLNVENSPAVRARASAVLEVERDVVEPAC